MRTPEQLTIDAWDAIDQLTASGQAKLPSGVVIVPEPKTVVDLLKWLASLQGRPRKTPKALDDWAPQETKI